MSNKFSNSKLRKLVNSQPNKVIVYLRVSTNKQERSGLGLDAQLSLCERTAEYLGLEIIDTYKESISGKVHPEKRPVFMQAVEKAQITGARLMVAKLDRFSREVYHVSGYTQHHIFGNLTPNMIIAESPNMSQLEIYMKAMISEEERKAIGKRTREALAELIKNGEELGEVGRQAAWDKARDKTADAMELAVKLREQGCSYQAIADTLNADGYTTSRGGQWYAANIRQRLKNIQAA